MSYPPLLPTVGHRSGEGHACKDAKVMVVCHSQICIGGKLDLDGGRGMRQRMKALENGINMMSDKDRRLGKRDNVGTFVAMGKTVPWAHANGSMNDIGDNCSIQGWHMESQNHPITTATMTWDAKPAPANRMMAHLVSDMKGDGQQALELLVLMEKMLMRHCVTSSQRPCACDQIPH